MSTRQPQQSVKPLAPMKPQVYGDPRPREYFDRFHRRARKFGPRWFVHGTVRFLMWLIGVPLFRVRVVGLENIPRSGPVILAPNHNSFMDHFLTGVYVPRHLRFWAKSNLFKPALAGWFFAIGGTFCGRRGAKPYDAEASLTAETLLRQGYAVTLYCEGGRSRSGKVADQAKSGIGHLVNNTGATVIPVAIHGSERCRNWRKLEFPAITVEFGTRLRYDEMKGHMDGEEQDVAEEILDNIRELKRDIVRPSGWFREWWLQGAKLFVTLPWRWRRKN